MPICTRIILRRPPLLARRGDDGTGLLPAGQHHVAAILRYPHLKRLDGTERELQHDSGREEHMFFGGHFEAAEAGTLMTP